MTTAHVPNFLSPPKMEYTKPLVCIAWEYGRVNATFHACEERTCSRGYDVSHNLPSSLVINIYNKNIALEQDGVKKKLEVSGPWEVI